MTRLAKALNIRDKGEVLSDGEQEILALHDKLAIAIEALKRIDVMGGTDHADVAEDAIARIRRIKS